MPHPTARFENPKYFEQSVSDYSDVVPLLQKKNQDAEHSWFFVGPALWSAKGKKSQTNL